VQVPQLIMPPQPSGAVPQFWPVGQVVLGTHGVPQTLGVPPPPQVAGAVQVPQLSMPPQPSAMEPQFWPLGQVVSGVQPQTLGVPPPPQVWGEVHAGPQKSMPPQPFGSVPQLEPEGHWARHPPPQTLGVPPPPQVCGEVQVPQLSIPPQPLEIVPQLSGAGQLVIGTQFEPQTLGVPPPPQVSGAVQAPPQVTMPPQPSGMVPQLSGAGQLVSGVQLQMSSFAGVDDCSQVSLVGQLPLVAVHCSQPPKSTLPLFVSQTGVVPVQAPPLSPQEHLRQPVTVVPEQTVCAVPVLVHFFWALLQSSCTYHLRPLTVIVSPSLPSPQMSPISPHATVSKLAST
jgi:hypothetical protein